MFVVVEFVNFFGGIAEQNAGQDKAQPVGLPWVEPKADQREQRVCLGGIENGLARQQHALDTALFQFSGNHCRFVVGAHQDGNIAGFQRAAFEVQTAFGCFIERKGNFIGAIFGGTAAQNLFAGLVVRIEPAHLDGGAVWRQPAFGAAGGDLAVIDVFQYKGVFFLFEQGADAVDQLGMAAVVDGKGVMPVRILRGLQIGVNVRTAKAVNRLLGVANEKQRAALFDKNLAENFVLQRVGILEFVNQRDFPVCRRRFCQCVAVFIGGQCLMDVQQQIVKHALAA